MQRSEGKFCRLYLSLVILCLFGCVSGTRSSDIRKQPAVAPDFQAPSLVSEPLAEEASLSEDQKELEELRQNVPEDRRQQNDELREILSFMGELKDPPHRVRERFDRASRRVREKHRKEVQRAREAFNKQEKEYRDTFYKKLKHEREDFLSSKPTREKRQKYFDEQDTQRRDFQADERDRRHQFTSDLKMKDDDFNQRLRDLTTEFNQEYKNYVRRYNEHLTNLKKQKEAQSRPPEGFVEPLKTGD
jgi:hypothetical protein